MQTPLALKNLADRPLRTIVSATGIGFAIVLMFLQLGFMGAVGDTAVKVFDRLDGELIIRSPEYLQIFDPRSVPSSLVPMILSVAEVADVRTIDLGLTNWRNPFNGELRPVALMGIDPERPSLNIDGIESLRKRLRQAQHVLVDSASRADYGPADGSSFGIDDIGTKLEITGQTVVITGTFVMGTGLAANAAVLTSHGGFNRLSPERLSPLVDQDRVSMIVIKLSGGVDPVTAEAAIKERLARLDGRSSSFKVMSMQEAIDHERWHWYVRTPIGIIFGAGVLIGVIVGGVICYMILAGDVIARLPEYATLKAIGYPNSYLMKVILGQAAWLAGLAFPPAILVSIALYTLTSVYSGVEIRMSFPRLILVAVLSMAMCGTAGWLALRKMTKAEPANLF